MQNRAMKTVELFLTFLKIGTFTFGGGYAMIPLIEREIVEKRKWIKKGDILDITAVAESTPGPIAVNTATFVGFKICGFWGAFFATFGVVLPSFLIIFALSFIIKKFENLKIVVFAFKGVRAGVLALIVKALFMMYKECPKNIFSYIIMLAAFVAVAVFKINVIIVIAICAAAGIIFAFIADKKVRV